MGCSINKCSPIVTDRSENVPKPKCLHLPYLFMGGFLETATCTYVHKNVDFMKILLSLKK